MARDLRTISVLLGLLLGACAADGGPGSTNGRKDGSADARTDGAPSGSDSSVEPFDSGAIPDEDAEVTPAEDAGVLIDPDAACARQSSETIRTPANLLIVLDRSGSMLDPTSFGGPSKWDQSKAAIERVLDQLPSETRIGVTFFPYRDGVESHVSDYATPTIAVAAIETTRPLIRQALIDRRPSGGGTPMACAFPAATQYMSSTFDSDGPRSVVLITDGLPTSDCTSCNGFSCTDAASTLINRAADLALAHRPTVLSFAIATADAVPSFMSPIAVHGGTARAPGCAANNSCHYLLGTSTFLTDLNRALDEIRNRAATCEFRITADTSQADENTINVNFQASSSDPMTTVPRDPNHTDGWDYGAGTDSVVFYGPACDRVRSSNGGNVQILFGCPTVIQPPPG